MFTAVHHEEENAKAILTIVATLAFVNKTTVKCVVSEVLQENPSEAAVSSVHHYVAARALQLRHCLTRVVARLREHEMAAREIKLDATLQQLNTIEDVTGYLQALDTNAWPNRFIDQARMHAALSILITKQYPHYYLAAWVVLFFLHERYMRPFCVKKITEDIRGLCENKTLETLRNELRDCDAVLKATEEIHTELMTPKMARSRL